MANSVNPVATDNQTETKSEKELNFERLRKENARIVQQAEQEREARLRVEAELNALRQQSPRPRQDEDDEDDSSSDEPYLDRRSFKKSLNRFEQKMEEKIERKAEEKARRILDEERKRDFVHRLKSEYRDFDEVLNEDSAEKFSQQCPDLAKEILAIPDEYQRRKMAYQTIKSIGLHKKEEPKQVGQDKVNQNLRNPYYSPTSFGNPGTAPMGDFSEAGQKAAFEKMQGLLKNRTGLR